MKEQNKTSKARRKQSQDKRNQIKIDSTLPEDKRTLTEIQKIAMFVTGEEALLEREQKKAEIKRKALERQKERVRIGIEQGNLKLEELDDSETNTEQPKVVQNIKVFEWDAPIRTSIHFEMNTYLSIVALCLLFMIYLAVLGHYGLMAVIIALLFLLYVAGVTPADRVKHSITTRGLDVFNKLYEWFMLSEFWFTKKNGQFLLHVNTKLRFPARLILLVEEKDLEPTFMLLQDKLFYRDVRKQSFVEKITDGQYVPLDKI